MGWVCPMVTEQRLAAAAHTKKKFHIVFCNGLSCEATITVAPRAPHFSESIFVAPRTPRAHLRTPLWSRSGSTGSTRPCQKACQTVRRDQSEIFSRAHPRTPPVWPDEKSLILAKNDRLGDTSKMTPPTWTRRVTHDFFDEIFGSRNF